MINGLFTESVNTLDSASTVKLIKIAVGNLSVSKFLSKTDDSTVENDKFM